MIDIILANSQKDLDVIERLASTIWPEHYMIILGEQQIDYMLKKFQSARAVQEQIKNGFGYNILYFEGVPVGYMSLKIEVNTLFLSKLYILSNYRGKKIGKTALNFAIDMARVNNINKLRLTVNIHNTDAIAAYEKLGFKNIGPVVADIGNGFVMDDYEMVKTI